MTEEECGWLGCKDEAERKVTAMGKAALYCLHHTEHLVARLGRLRRIEVEPLSKDA